jgi:hypothetical protein
MVAADAAVVAAGPVLLHPVEKQQQITCCTHCCGTPALMAADVAVGVAGLFSCRRGVLACRWSLSWASPAATLACCSCCPTASCGASSCCSCHCRQPGSSSHASTGELLRANPSLWLSVTTGGVFNPASPRDRSLLLRRNEKVVAPFACWWGSLRRSRACTV